MSFIDSVCVIFLQLSIIMGLFKKTYFLSKSPFLPEIYIILYTFCKGTNKSNNIIGAPVSDNSCVINNIVFLLFIFCMMVFQFVQIFDFQCLIYGYYKSDISILL